MKLPQLKNDDLERMGIIEKTKPERSKQSKQNRRIAGIRINDNIILIGKGVASFFALIGAWYFYGRTPDYIKKEEGLTHIAIADEYAKGTLENGEQIDIGETVLSYKLFSKNRRIFGGKDGIAYAQYYDEISDKYQYVAVKLSDFSCSYTFEDAFLDKIQCVSGIRKGIDHCKMITDDGYEITIDSDDAFFSAPPNSEGQIDTLFVDGNSNRISTGKMDSSQIMYFTDQKGPTEYVDVKLVPNKKETRTGNKARPGRDVAVLSKIGSKNSSVIYYHNKVK